MRTELKGAFLTLLLLAVTGLVAALVFVKTTGLSARATPGPIETAVARRLQSWAVPGEYRELSNPVLRNEESIRSGMAHFADHHPPALEIVQVSIMGTAANLLPVPGAVVVRLANLRKGQACP